MSRLIRRELKYKIISIVLAIIVWFYVRGEVGYGHFFYHAVKGRQIKVFEDIPITIMQHSSKEMRSVRVVPDKVQVEITGNRKQLEALSPKDIVLYTRVGGFVDGTYQMIVYDQLPHGFKLKVPLASVSVIVETYHKEEGVNVAHLAQDLMTQTDQAKG